jgi:electron transport complex protein RnfG
MNEIVKMIVVLTLISGVCGLGLAGLKAATAERIEMQELIYGKKPALERLFKDAEGNPIYKNDPLEDRKKFELDEKNKIIVFPLIKDGKLFAIAFEVVVKGYGGDIGVMAAFDVTPSGMGKLYGVDVTKQMETTGFADKSQRKVFLKQFREKPFDQTGLGKGIDGISGATISSTAACGAVADAIGIFKKHKDALIALFQIKGKSK